MAGRAAEAAAVSALALLVTLVIAAPVLRAPSERLFGMDIVGRHHDPFTVMEQFGRPITVGIYSQPVTDVAGALLARTAGPVAAYNWLVLLTFPLSTAAAYLLARHLALRPAAAAVAAIAFAFSPFHLSHAAYHPHIAQTQWVALYLLALWRCLDAASPTGVAFLGLATAAVVLSNFYAGLIVAVVTPVAIAAYWMAGSRHGERSTRRLAVTIASLVVIAGAGATYAWYQAPAVVVDPTAFAFPREDLFRYSARWWSYLVPPVEHPWLGGIARGIWARAGMSPGLLEQQVTIGWGILALGVVATIGWGARDRQPSLAKVPALAAVAAVALVCSLSPEREIGPFTVIRPSDVLYGIVPMFRAYARFGVIVQLMAALLAGMGVEYLLRARTRRARVACAALLILAVSEYAVWPPALSRDVLPTAAHRWVARQPDQLRVLDCAPLTPESASVEWLTGYRVSLLGAFFDDCTEPHFPQKLAVGGYTHLLARRDTPEGRSFAAQRTPDGLHPQARFADSDVFAVTAPAPSVYTAQMNAFDGREYDDEWTWRWMGSDASWTIVNASGRPMLASVEIEMSAFDRPRGLELRLDGRDVQKLIVEKARHLCRIGPLALTPGHHDLVFHPVDPPTVADTVMNNGDSRPLSFAVGTWRWAVEAEQP